MRAQLASFEQWQRPPVLPPSSQDDIDAWGESVLEASDYVAPQPDRRTQRIDRVLLHPLWGTVIFFAVMFYFFQVLFTAAAPLRDGISHALTWLGGQVVDHVGNPVLRGLLSQGLIGGVGTVLQFIPQIVLLFCLLAFLESVGYMSRAAFLMDRVMATTGLEGRAFVAMLSSLIPYTLELITLRRMRAASFGLLMSLEPAVAALAGVVVLGQQLTFVLVAALVLVVGASVGTTITGRSVSGEAGDVPRDP